MGVYRTDYKCGCYSQGDSYSSDLICGTCDGHKRIVGSKFKAYFCGFIKKYRKSGDLTLHPKSNIEIISNFRKNIGDKYIDICQFKTDLDCSKFDLTKQLFFSDLNDAPSWQLLEDGNYLVILYSHEFYFPLEI